MYKKLVFITLISFSFIFLVILLSATIQPVNADTSPTPTPTLIPEEFRWDLEAIYPDVDAWEKDAVLVENSYIPEYKKYFGKLGDAKMLLKFLEMDEKTQRTNDKLYVYAYMKSDENQKDSAASERAARADSLYTNIASERSFVNPELVSLPDATIKAYMADKRFEKYVHFLDSIIKKKSHTLPQAEEQLLAEANDATSGPDKIAGKIRDADMLFPTIKNSKGEEVELSEAVYGAVLNDADRDFRKAGFEGIMSGYDKYKFSLATALDAQMRIDAFYAKTRKYDSALQASLDSNDIPQEVYDNLLKAVDKNLKVLHQYVSLRKAVLGVDKIHYYDMYNPLVESYTVFTPYDKAKLTILSALSPLGEDYIDTLKTGFNSRWIDVYESDGKTSGAYAWGSYDTHPYVLANYNGSSVDGVLTIAHEMGHAINSDYTNETQAYINSNIPIFTAEIASTTNELLVLNYLLDKAKDDDARLYYLNQMAENIRGTFFAQVMYADFEKQIHDRVENGDALSVDSLNQLWSDVVTKYYGADFEMDDQAKLVWARIPHFYYNFYVYQYATGLAASNQFVKNILDNKDGAVEKYLTFLKAGSSDFPVSVLKASGIDMTSSTPVDNLIADFGKVITQMQDILKKQGKIK